MRNDAELEKNNPSLYEVAKKGGTEPRFSSKFLKSDAEGIFHCAVCNAPLFSSDTKFDSGTGWPSFTSPITPDAVLLIEDTTHGMSRTEVQCATCKSHLGHVFNDGPKMEGSTKLHDRYCMNGVCLDLEEKI